MFQTQYWYNKIYKNKLYQANDQKPTKLHLNTQLLLKIRPQIDAPLIYNFHNINKSKAQLYSMQLPRERSRHGNSRESSLSKGKDKQNSKSKPKKGSRRLSFESPKNSKRSDGGLSLLNYMLLRQRMDKAKDAKEKISKASFKQLYVVGKGGFGRVWKVQQKTTGKLFAMKQMSKAVVLAKNSQKSVMNQRQLISYLRHPFLVNIAYAFQDRDNLYLIMDLMPGGDLRFHLCNIDNLRQEIVKFIAACIIVSIEFLHNNGVIHRDIKPQNIVIDSKGYFRLTDLGIAMVARPGNHQNTSGTPGYMAPEVITRQDHSFPVDFFALGVIVYECTLGKRPYRGRDRKQIRQAMLAREMGVRPSELPLGWSLHAIDFINRLLKRKPEQRLGTRGMSEVKNHPWLSDINWKKLIDKQIASPFYVDISSNNFDQPSITENDQETQQKINNNILMLRMPGVANIFEGYEYQPVSMY